MHGLFVCWLPKRLGCPAFNPFTLRSNPTGSNFFHLRYENMVMQLFSFHRYLQIGHEFTVERTSNIVQTLPEPRHTKWHTTEDLQGNNAVGFSTVIQSSNWRLTAAKEWYEGKTPATKAIAYAYIVGSAIDPEPIGHWSASTHRKNHRDSQVTPLCACVQSEQIYASTLATSGIELCQRRLASAVGVALLRKRHSVACKSLGRLSATNERNWQTTESDQQSQNG